MRSAAGDEFDADENQQQARQDEDPADQEEGGQHQYQFDRRQAGGGPVTITCATPSTRDTTSYASSTSSALARTRKAPARQPWGSGSVAAWTSCFDIAISLLPGSRPGCTLLP